METHTMLLDWKNQYCQNDYITQGNLLNRHNSYQIRTLFKELEQKILNFVWKHKIPQIAKTILRKKTELEESDYTTKPQSSNQYDIAQN